MQLQVLRGGVIQKKMEIRKVLIDFLDEIRNYERESHNMLGFDERESEEFVDIFIDKNKSINSDIQQQDEEKNICRYTFNMTCSIGKSSGFAYCEGFRERCKYCEFIKKK